LQLYHKLRKELSGTTATSLAGHIAIGDLFDDVSSTNVAGTAGDSATAQASSSSATNSAGFGIGGGGGGTGGGGGGGGGIDALQSATRSETPTVVATAGRTARWLVLHGHRTNATIVSQQVGFLQRRGVLGLDDHVGLDDYVGDGGAGGAKGRGRCELTFVEGPFPCRGDAPPGISSAAHGPLYEWWTCDSRDPAHVKSADLGWIGSTGLDESVAYLAAEVGRLQRSDGLFDGVIGFSQGAAMAWRLVADGLVAKAVLFSPVDPGAAGKLRPWSSLPMSSSAVVGVISDPEDLPAQAFVESFVRAHPPTPPPLSSPTSTSEGASRIQVWSHGEGHAIPAEGGPMKDAYTAVGRFLRGQPYPRSV
jgi:hypothetical protein